jgi:hypothetical protein
VHGSNPAASRLQEKVEPASLELKVNVAEADVAAAGGVDPIVVSGGIVSTIQL